MRTAPFPLLLALCGAACTTPTEDRERLEDFQLRATQYYEAGDLPRAEQQARQGLAIEPNHTMLNLILGRTLLRWHDLRSVARSREYLEKAYGQEQDFRTAYSLGEFHLRYAEFLLGKGEELKSRAGELRADEDLAKQDLNERAGQVAERAAEHLTKSAALLEEALLGNPRSIFALRLLANCYAHQEKDEEALRALKLLNEELLASRQWKNERLAMEALTVPEEERLRSDLREDLRMEVEAFGLAATILKRQRRFRESADMLTEALRVNPDLEREYFNRGMCYYWMGDLASSAADMREFLRRTALAFEAEEVAQALDIVSEYEAQTGRTAN